MIQSKRKIAGFVAACISLIIFIGTTYAALTGNAGYQLAKNNGHAVYSAGGSCKGITNKLTTNDIFVPTGPAGTGTDFPAFLASIFANTSANVTQNNCLVNNVHDEKDCTDLGNGSTVYGNHCKILSSSCGSYSGWANAGYSEFAATTCSPDVSQCINEACFNGCTLFYGTWEYDNPLDCWAGRCLEATETGSTAAQAYSNNNTAPTDPYKDRVGLFCGTKTCTATKTKIGCY